MTNVIDDAVTDATTLVSAGFPALMVENFGDVPFHADKVPPVTVAAMTTAISAIQNVCSVPIGVNVLRNDALAAVGIAAATGASFVRINVLTGMMYTDQGPIVGKADEVLRAISELGIDVSVWADVMVKHATPPPGMDPVQSALDTIERGLADAVIISGSGTGFEPNLEEAHLIRSAIPKQVRLVVGSGATVDNLGGLATVADTVIVGSSLKPDSNPQMQVDRLKAEQFVEAATKQGMI